MAVLQARQGATHARHMQGTNTAHKHSTQHTNNRKWQGWVVPVSGWRSSSGALSLVCAASTLFDHASVHSNSNSVSVRAILLYCLTARTPSGLVNSPGNSWKLSRTVVATQTSVNAQRSTHNAWPPGMYIATTLTYALNMLPAVYIPVCSGTVSCFVNLHIPPAIPICLPFVPRVDPPSPKEQHQEALPTRTGA